MRDKLKFINHAILLKFINDINVWPKVQGHVHKIWGACIGIGGRFEKKKFGAKEIFAVGFGLATVLICIILAIPFIKIPYQVTETHYETELKRESYVVNQPYTALETVEKSKILFNDFRIVIPGGVDIPFQIDKPHASLIASF